VWQTFLFHPLTFRHRVNYFIAQQIYSPGGLKPTGEDENRLFAKVLHRDFNISNQTTLKNHGLGKVHVPGCGKLFPFTR
jgi:hypothetical protein